MRDQILRFLQAIDSTLAKSSTETDRLDFYLIGKAALILFYGVGQSSATRDVDVVHISWPLEPLLERAVQLFGKESDSSTTYGLYLEAVPGALPPLSGSFRQRCRLFDEGAWQVLKVYQLDIHDLAVSKLKRFAAKDRQDLQELCDRGLLRSEELTSILESAFIWTTEKDGDTDRDNAFAALRQVIAYIQGETRTL